MTRSKFKTRRQSLEVHLRRYLTTSTICLPDSLVDLFFRVLKVKLEGIWEMFRGGPLRSRRCWVRSRFQGLLHRSCLLCPAWLLTILCGSVPSPTILGGLNEIDYSFTFLTSVPKSLHQKFYLRIKVNANHISIVGFSIGSSHSDDLQP